MVSGATKANVNRHFASAVRGKNLGDVTAKAQSQGVFAYVLGLFYGVGISYICQTSGIPYLIIGNFVLLNCIHLFCSYRCLSSINIRHLNPQRGEIVINSYLDKVLSKDDFQIISTDDADVIVPSPKDVAKKEVFVLNYKEKYAVNMGVSIEQLVSPTCNLKEILSHTTFHSDDNDDKITNYESYLIRARNGQIQIAFHENSSESDFFKAFFHAQVYIWMIRNSHHSKEEGDVSIIDDVELWKKSYDSVQKSFSHFLTTISKVGWATNYIQFFEPKQSARFQFEMSKADGQKISEI